MGVSAAERAAALELFEDLGEITGRRMMGGMAIYASGRIFAILLSDGRLCLKARGAFAEALAAAGSEEFVHLRANGREARMGYWTLPEPALDDPEQACAWARQALEAAG